MTTSTNDIIEDKLRKWHLTETYNFNKYLKHKKNLKKHTTHKRKVFCQKCHDFHMKKDNCAYDEYMLELESLEDFWMEQLKAYENEILQAYDVKTSNNDLCKKTNILKTKASTFYCIDCEEVVSACHFCDFNSKNFTKKNDFKEEEYSNNVTYMYFKNDKTNIYVILLNKETLSNILTYNMKKYDILKTSNTLSKSLLHLCCTDCIVLENVKTSNNDLCEKTNILKTKASTFYCIDCEEVVSACHFCDFNSKNFTKKNDFKEEEYSNNVTYMYFKNDKTNIYVILLNKETLSNILTYNMKKYDILKTSNTLSKSLLHLCCTDCIVLEKPGFLI